MSQRPTAGKLQRGREVRQSLAELVALARCQAKALGRIARAYEEHMTGRCDTARMIEVVRQEITKVERQTRQARRRSRPVRG